MMEIRAGKWICGGFKGQATTMTALYHTDNKHIASITPDNEHHLRAVEVPSRRRQHISICRQNAIDPISQPESAIAAEGCATCKCHIGDSLGECQDC